MIRTKMIILKNPEYEDLGGGDYVVKTCYSNQEEGNSG